jgi:hypothetical protein
MAVELNLLRMALQDWEGAADGPDRETAAIWVSVAARPSLLRTLLAELDDALDRLDVIRDRDR